MTLSFTRLESGYTFIRGSGLCNWAQPRVWPCSEQHLREHAFPEASEEFIQAVMRTVSQPLPWQSND